MAAAAAAAAPAAAAVRAAAAVHTSLQQEAGRRIDGFNHTVVHTLCLSWAQALQLAISASTARSVQDAAAYCAAADAGLRLLPLLLSAVAPDGSEAEQQQGTAGSEGGSDSGPACEAEDMAQRFADVVWEVRSDRLRTWAAQFRPSNVQPKMGRDSQQQQEQGSGGSGEWQGSSSGGSAAQAGGSDSSGGFAGQPLPPPPPPELVTQLFQLHATACRLLACLSKQAAPSQLWLVQLWLDLATGCTAVLHAVRDMLSCCSDPVRCGTDSCGTGWAGHLHVRLPPSNCSLNRLLPMQPSCLALCRRPCCRAHALPMRPLLCCAANGGMLQHTTHTWRHCSRCWPPLLPCQVVTASSPACEASWLTPWPSHRQPPACWTATAG